MLKTINAAIGDRSIMPTGGIKRLKIAKKGSESSYINLITGL
jgi:hypothetical protein